MMSESNKQQAVNKLTEIVANFTAMISTRMPDDVVDKLKQLKDAETSSMGKIIYHTMFDNMQKAIDLNRPACQDTGYIGSKKCTCFKKAEIELLYAQSNLNEILEKENFDSSSCSSNGNVYGRMWKHQGYHFHSREYRINRCTDRECSRNDRWHGGSLRSNL